LFIKLVLLIEVGAFFVYKINSPIGNFILYSFVFYRFIVSKNIVFWTAFLFLILNNPWGLFYYRPHDWYISLTSTVGISYVSMFGIVFLIKSFFYFKKRKFIIKDLFLKFYKPIGIFIIFMLLWSFVYGHNVISIFKIIQFFPAFLLFISVPRLLSQYELPNFNNIIFLFSLLHFFGSIIDIATRGAFIQFVSFGKSVTGAAYDANLIRFVGGITIHLYVMIIGLYYLAKKEKYFNSGYLWTLVLVSYIFILSSATRGWMIASTILLFAFYIVNVLRGKSSVKAFATMIFVLIIGFLLLPQSFKKNLDAAFNRLETVEALAEGDETAGGTLSRLTERGPRVLTRFWESPIVGFGYSKVSSQYFDPHVGNHSLLLLGGILGLVIMWFSFLFMSRFLFHLDIRFPGNSFYIIGLAIIIILIIHSSSRTMISYYMPADAAFLIALFLNHVNATFTFYPENKNEIDFTNKQTKLELK